MLCFVVQGTQKWVQGTERDMMANYMAHSKHTSNRDYTDADYVEQRHIRGLFEAARQEASRRAPRITMPADGASTSGVPPVSSGETVPAD